MSSNDSHMNAASETDQAQQHLIVALNPYVQRCLKRRQQRRPNAAAGLSSTEHRPAHETVPQGDALQLATVPVESRRP
jgi:hypothetical protein